MSSAISDPDKFIDELFKPLFFESENITIECNEYKFRYEDDYAFDIKIKSVNDCNSWNELKEKLTRIYKPILSDLKDILKPLSQDAKLSLLESIRSHLEFFRDININTSSYHFKGSEYGPDEDNEYIYLPNANFTVSRDGVPEAIDKYIHYKTSVFAESFLVVFNEVIAKIEFLINNIELLPDLSQLQDAPVIVPKFKTSLSVSEIAYFFKLLKEENIIIVPDGSAESYYRSISETFSSKQKNVISSSSLKNKLLDPDDPAMEYWHIKFADIIKRIKKDRGKI
jgi:hypothetical protein